MGLKFNDIDFTNAALYVTRQIGRALDNSGLDNGTLTVQEVRTKTPNSVRVVPLADFVIDELILARVRYEETKNANPVFSDLDYISCNEMGYARNRSFVQKPFKRLLKEWDLPPFRWHDIRHIYATLLKKNEGSLKAISVSLGHASIQTTDEVYIYKEQTILDCRPYMEAIASKILHQK